MGTERTAAIQAYVNACSTIATLAVSDLLWARTALERWARHRDTIKVRYKLTDDEIYAYLSASPEKAHGFTTRA